MRQEFRQQDLDPSSSERNEATRIRSQAVSKLLTAAHFVLPITPSLTLVRVIDETMVVGHAHPIGVHDPIARMHWTSAAVHCFAQTLRAV